MNVVRRGGMRLTKALVDMLGFSLDKFEYVNGLYICKLEHEPTIYLPKKFIKDSPALYELYTTSKANKLGADFIDYHIVEAVEAVKSGYLKHDSRGYHFDRSSKARVELIKCITF